MIHHEVLPNGLTLLVREMRAAPVVTLNLWIGTGSAEDPKSHSGVSHFLEHMVLKGTPGEPRGELAEVVQGAGGYLNAATGCDHTMFYQVVPTRNWQDVLETQIDVLSTPRFREEEVESERSVIVEETLMAERDPMTFVWRRVMESVLPEDAYGRPVTGTPESLARTDAAVLLDHHTRHYVPGNMVQVVAGDVSLDEAARCSRELLSRFHGDPVHARPERRPARWKRGFHVHEGAIERPYVAIAYQVPDALHDDTPALDVLCGILGLGRSSRLRKSLHTSLGIAAQVGAGVAAYRGTGVLAVRAVGSEGISAERLVEESLRQVARLRDEAVTGEEMEKSLKRLEAGYLLEHETSESIAATLGYCETMKSYEYAETYIDRLAAVTPHDITRAANDYMTDENIAVVAYVPANEGGKNVSGHTVTAEGLARAARSARPHAGAAVEEGPEGWSAPAVFTRPDMLLEDGSANCARTELRDGASLVVRESHALPLVSFALTFAGGFTDEPAGRGGLTGMTLKHVLRGTSSRSEEQLADDIEGLGTGLSISVDRDGFGLGATVLSKHLAEALEIIGDVLASPEFAAESLLSVREEVISEIAGAEDNPFRRTMMRLVPLLFPGHAYGRPLTGSRECVESIEARETAEWRRTVFTADRVRACVCGDVTSEQTAPLIEKILTGIEGRSVRAECGHSGRPSGRVDERLPRGGQSTIAVGYRGPAIGTRDSAALQVVCSALTMMGGRLWKELRERPPYAYTVRAMPVSLRHGGAFVGFVTAPPGQEETAAETMVTEFSRVAEGGLSAEELETARRYVAGMLEISLQRGSSRAASYALAEVSGIGYEHVDRMADIARSVTAEDVERMARLYMKAEDEPAVVILRG